jgi:Tol biopolymer transport system component
VKVERVSPPPLDLEVSVPAGTSPKISADGRFVGFMAGDGNIYVRDRQSGQTELASVTASGTSVKVLYPTWSISADGRFVAFMAGVFLAHFASPEIYVRDRQMGKTELVSVAVDGSPAHGASPAISADGRFVAFVSGADDLVPGDTNGKSDIFVRDRQTGKTERVSADTGVPVDLNSGKYPRLAISTDGRFVTFESHTSLLVWDRQTGQLELVSVAADGGPANGESSSPSISADGRFVAFVSQATNLLPGDTDAGLFVRDRQAGKTERLGYGENPAISSDGRFAAFEADEAIVVQDRQTGKTERVSIRNSGAPVLYPSSPSITSDGRFVAFQSEAAIGGSDIFVRDRATSTMQVIKRLVNVSREPLNSDQPTISADGQWVAFVTAGQVFERNRITGAAALVSTTPSGAPAHGDSFYPRLSADGRFIAFGSFADDLVPGDANGDYDIFLRDRQTGKVELVSVAADGGPAHGESESPQPLAISADGRLVAFQSQATNLVPGDTNGSQDIFVRDRQTQKTEAVSIAVNGTPANGSSLSLAISADGRFVAFGSGATNLVPGETRGGLFLRDRQTGQTERLADGYYPSISADGRFIVFTSGASDLVPGDTNGKGDVFMRDRRTGRTELVSIAMDGGPANGDSYTDYYQPTFISTDGRFIVFVSSATNLVSGDTNNVTDVFVRDRQTGKTDLVSVGANDKPAGGSSPEMSADGRFITFVGADNLVPGDTNGKLDVFVAERE